MRRALIGMSARIAGDEDARTPSQRDDCHVNGSLDREWDWLFACAQAFDETCADRSKTWPPPIMTPLAAAAAETSLRRFYPFLSHHLLCLGTSPAWFLQGAVAPACIGVANNPDIYNRVVWPALQRSGPQRP